MAVYTSRANVKKDAVSIALRAIAREGSITIL